MYFDVYNSSTRSTSTVVVIATASYSYTSIK